MPTKKLGSLSDIDGLRALAVVAVVLFHLDFEFFQGGYVGVDIFFVISGFLISGLIRERIALHQFSLADFYANRIRRLLPAILATVFATTVASLFILQPQMLEDFSVAAIASMFSVANINFYLEAGYWDANSKLKPLLHMWSLGVEEQFYMLWPTLLLLSSRLRSNLYIPLLLTITASGLAVNLLASSVDTAGPFYLLPYRIWQFSLGALALEMWRANRYSLFTQQCLRAMGLALCCITIITPSGTAQLASSMILLPNVGAVLILLACDHKASSLWLSNPLSRWLGKISYALYLVHWPVIALYKVWTLADLTPLSQLGLGALVMVLTGLLHYGIEIRFYQRGVRVSGVNRWQGVPKACFVGVLISTGLLTLIAYRPDFYALRQSVLDTESIKSYQKDRFKHLANTCQIKDFDTSPRCRYRSGDAILIIGNSHEVDGFNIIRAALPETQQTDLVRFGGIETCQELQLIGDWPQAADKNCQHRLTQLASSIEKIQWKAVIFSARRPYAINKNPLIAVLKRIKHQQPDAQIIVFEDYITTREDCAMLINQTGTPLSCRQAENVEYFAASPAYWLGQSSPDWVNYEAISALADDYFDKIELLCPNGQMKNCPVATPDGHPMAVDTHHLTYEFASWMGFQLAANQPPWFKALTNSP